MKNTKALLLQKCKSLVEDQKVKLELEIKLVQKSANEETKSSAGDKYETGRAMAQLEIEKLTRRLAETESMIRVLHQINPNEEKSLVVLGSLISTDTANYFISIPLGAIDSEGLTWFCISPKSPIGNCLMGLKLHNSYVWNGKSDKILALE